MPEEDQKMLPEGWCVGPAPWRVLALDRQGWGWEGSRRQPRGGVRHCGARSVGSAPWELGDTAQELPNPWCWKDQARHQV